MIECAGAARSPDQECVLDLIPDHRQASVAPTRRHPFAGGRAMIDRLRSRPGLLGQIVRFGLAGGVVTIVYVIITTVLSQVVGLPFEVALAIGFVSALLLHFTFQRLFVWVHDEGFALTLSHQVRRYLVMAGTQYGCTAAAVAVLPGVLGVPTEVVYLATMAVVTTTGFLVMRFIIFHGDESAESARASAVSVR
jgi:putative flippase GtrA